MTLIGIDPGKQGGVAWLVGDTAAAVRMPETVADLVQLLESLPRPARAVIEHVASTPQMGVVSAFTFGRGYGQIEGVLAALRIPYERVAPGVWQRALGCLSRGDKRVTKRRAQELYPTLGVTHATADAILIATWAARKT